MEFERGAFEVSIEDGVITFTWPGGYQRGMPLRVGRICHARMETALAEYDARQAVVVPIKPRRGHAARS